MTRTSMLMAGVAFLACVVPGVAMAEDFQGWYLGLGVGYDGLSDMQATWGGPQPPGVANLGFNNAALGIASFGYKWGDFRGEAELGYAEHSLLKGIFAGAPDAGRFSVGSLLFNLDYDLPLGWGGLKWTVGAGVGIGNIQSTVNAGRPFGGDVIHGADSGFMWQVKSGFSLPVWDSLEGFVEYRYRQVDANSVESDFASIGPVHLESPTENVAMLGIRWYLEPPPPVVKTFIVFFDFDKSDLTDKAVEVVGEAVRTAKTEGMVKVLVTGHTDTVGSDQYNQALSERRANAVKDEMIKEGMDGGSISIEGKSFHDPLVATGPGVREPQNRRAVIDLGN